MSITEEPRPWPTLPEHGFVFGRCATEDDFQQGRVVFRIKSNDHDVQPYAIAVPQYVIWREEAGEVGKRAILVQAEQTIDGIMTGLHDLEGSRCVCTLAELEPLGVERPE